MSIIQPQATDSLNSPSHSFLHRVFAADSSAPVESVIVDASGNVGITGNLTANIVSAVYGKFYGAPGTIPRLYLSDFADANFLGIRYYSTLTTTRYLNLYTGDANRSLTLAGDATISGTNTGDQDLSTLVPKTTTVNTKALSANIVLTPDDLDDTSTSHKFVASTDITNWNGKDTKTDLTKYSNLNLPEGTMFNGKIVPSVTSGNLTVALKGMDGNDPSATNPVYVRIGDAIRAITGALSVTKNAGTSYCNAGATEFATKEIDYFVYLGYNATDGVTIGFSRYNGNLYSDFSATNTNEKYCAISTITNAVAGDNYVNIGRFAATLSAGAGYTWSVPTFTASNLIQKPVYETRWLFWNPVLTAGSSDLSGYDEATYKLSGEILSFRFRATNRSMSGSAGTSIISMPFATVESNETVIGNPGYNGTTNLFMAARAIGSTLVFYKDAGIGNWAGNETPVYFTVHDSLRIN